MSCCERCGYTGSRKHLIQHLKRKKLCQPTVSDAQPVDQLNALVRPLERNHACKACGKTFTSASNMYRHKQTVCEKAKGERESTEMASMKKELEDLRLLVEDLKSTPKGPVFNNCNISVVQNNNMNVFGKEDISHMTHNPLTFKRFLTTCVQEGGDGVCNFMSKKHFSPKNPQNHNMMKTNKKDNTIKVLVESNNEKQWKVDTCENVLTKVLGSIQNDFALLNTQDLKSVPKNDLGSFIRTIYIPLNWSIDHWEEYREHFVTNNDISSMPCNKQCRKRIIRRAKEAVYRGTQTIKK